MNKFLFLILFFLFCSCKKNNPDSSNTTKALKVATTNATYITFNSVVLGGNILEQGIYPITKQGVVYSINSIIDTINILGGIKYHDYVISTGGYGVSINDLTPNTKYFFKAFVISNNTIVFGNELSFTTLIKASPTIPIVSLDTIYNATYSSVQCKGSIISDGGVNIIEQGFLYSTSPNPTINNSKRITDFSFNDTLLSLINSTKYYVKAYAINSVGIGYSNIDSFTTPTPPIQPQYTVYKNTYLDTSLGEYKAAIYPNRKLLTIYNDAILPNGINLYAYVKSISNI